MNEAVRLGIGVVLLAGISIGALSLARVDRRAAVLTALLRAIVQLGLVVFALRGVFAVPGLAALALAVMFGVASWTAASRLRGMAGAPRAVVLAVAAGSAVSIGIICGLPVLDRSVSTLVAVSGIVVGSAMTATVLAGRRLRDDLVARHDEVEAWLSLGATPRQAVGDIARHAAGEALIPGLDQTRTVGLVTLPGAFVGALLGGADVADAARFQIVVLVGLLCAQSIAAVVFTHLLGAPRTLPAAAGSRAGG